MSRPEPTTLIPAATPPAALHLPADFVSTDSERTNLAYQAYDLYCGLLEAGQSVDPDEFCAHYPSVQDSLRKAIRAHRFLNDNSALVKLCEEEDVDWPEPGDEFAGFRLLRELGRGAFARVFEANEPALGNRHVAVKTSVRGNAEAVTLGPLAHPNIVPIFSVAVDAKTGLTGVCMPYLGERTLLTVLDDIYGRSEQTEASDAQDAYAGTLAHQPKPYVSRPGSHVDYVRGLAIQLADALAFIHGKGICHRDIKPSNILISPDGTPMLLDFNLAADVQCLWTLPGGTPSYMSPEDLGAVKPFRATTVRRPDARSDLYSLGVVLYEVLTGQHPFGPLAATGAGGPNFQALVARQQQGFTPIRELRPEVDGALASVVERCLAFDPQARPRTAAEVLKALRRSQSIFARTARWFRRQVRAVAIVGVMFVIALSAAIYRARTLPPPELTHARQGHEAFAQGDFTLAIHHFSESLRIKPNQPEMLFARGRGYLKLAATDNSKYSLAGADFAQAKQRASEERFQGQALAFLAYTAQLQDQQFEAIKLYTDGLAKGFETAEVHNNLAKLYVDRSEVPKAQGHLDMALAMRPDLDVAHSNQAFLCFQQALRGPRSPVQQALLKKGIDHFRRIKAKTGGMNLLGALMCASASGFDGSWVAPTLEYLGEAIDQGIQPSQWQSQRLFTSMKNTAGYQALLARSPRPSPTSTAAVYLLEPTP